MTDTTRTIIRAAVEADKTLTPTDREAIESVMDSRDPFDTLPRLVRYEEAAAQLRCSRSRIKQLVASGALVRVVPHGGVRAIGVTERSLRELLSGGRGTRK